MRQTKIQPEALIGRLADRTAEVASASARMNAGEQAARARQKLSDVRRELELRRLLWDARAIAVTGLQGAGKSTFVLHLYGNTPALAKYLPISHSRDEKLSILIRENGGNGVTGGAMVMRQDPVSGDSVLHRVTYGPAEFVRMTREAPADHVVMTLEVPSRYFGDETQGILLTPGIEDMKDAWSQGAQNAVFASQQVIIVANPTQISSDQSEVLRDIASRFEDCHFIPVLTHCDDPAGQYGDLANSMGELLSRSGSDVVTFGVYGENAPETWLQRNQVALVKRIASATGTPASYRARQHERIRRLVEDDGQLELAFSDLQNLAEDAIENASTGGKPIARLLQIFNKEREVARRQLQRALNEHIGMKSAALRDHLEKALEGRDGWDRFKMWVAGFDLKDKRYLEGLVQNAWRASTPGLTAQTALGSAANQGIARFQFGQMPQSVLAETRIHQMLLSDGQATAEVSNKAPGGDSLVGAEMNEETRMSFNNTSKMLPHFGMALMSRTTEVALARPGIGEGKLDKLAKLDTKFLNDTLQAIKGTNEFGKDAAASIVATVVGADALDGSPDGIKTVLSAAGVTVSPTVVAAIGAGVALAAVGVVAVSIKRQLSASDLQMASMAEQLATAHEEAFVKSVLDQFDGMMDTVEARYDNYLQRLLGVDSALDGAVKTLVSLKKARDARVDILQLLESRPGLDL